MSIADKISNFYNALDQRFYQLFHEVLKDFNERAVHEFRVNIKKQVAFFHLLKGIDPRFRTEKAEALFFNLFKYAGAIRKVHIEKNILTNVDLNVKLSPEILENLELQLAKKTEKYLQYDHKKDLHAIIKNRRLIRNRISRIPENHLNNGLNEYFLKLLEGLRSQSELCKLSETAFHDLRKLLKELFYNLFLINQLLEQRQFTPDILKYLDQLQTSLGEWHDIHLTLKHFSKLENPDFSQL